MLNIVHQLSCLDPESSSGGRFFKGDSSRYIVIARRHDEAISLEDSSMEIASANENLLRKDGFLRDELTESLG
jgi:hypothetical protein